MDARELNNSLHYIGMEKALRRILIEEKIAEPEEVAVMTSVEACDKLLEEYEVVSCGNESITIVKHSDMDDYNRIAKHLCR